MKTLISALCLTLMTGLAAPLAAQELLTNGDFEQALDVGWKDTIYLLAGTFLFERSDTLGSTGGAARVRKDLASFAALAQQVNVPGVNLALSFDGRFRIGGGSSTCWPVAALIVRYQSNAGRELGNTKFVLHNEFCTWANSDTAHLVEIAAPEEWHSHQLDLARELNDFLPGVNPADVAQVRIEIHAYDSGT